MNAQNQKALSTLKSEIEDFTNEDINFSGRTLVVELIDDALKITDENLPEFPVFLSTSSDLMVVWTVLMSRDQVPKELHGEIAEILLNANSVTGLSNFSIDEGNYVLSGELSASSPIEIIFTEIDELMSNTVTGLQIFVEVLNKNK